MINQQVFSRCLVVVQRVCQVSDALAAGERHSERLARAQKHLTGGVAQPATGINRDGTVQTEREDSMREGLGHGTVHVPMGVQTLTTTTEPPTVGWASVLVIVL